MDAYPHVEPTPPVRIGTSWFESRAADLTTVDDVDAWVVPSNVWLTASGTLAARVHALAGPGLESESVAWGPRDVGDVVVTGGHRLPVERVIHVVTPHASTHGGLVDGLEAAYRRGWTAAARAGADRVACPLLSTGRRGTTRGASVAAALAAARSWTTRWHRPLTIVLASDTSEDHDLLRAGLEALSRDVPLARPVDAESSTHRHARSTRPSIPHPQRA